MSYRQTRIFVPNTQPFETEEWVETLAGSVIQQSVEAQPVLEWYWFSRYVADISDSGDCDIQKIPADFALQPSALYQSLRFRYSIPDDLVMSFEDDVRRRFESLGCRASDFRDYAMLDDLASVRFVGGEYTQQRRERRAARIVSFLHATCRLFLDTLEGPDAAGHFRCELNTEKGNNPYGSTFESVHHLFCNITQPPLHVLVVEPILGTRMYPSSGVQVREVRVRF